MKLNQVDLICYLNKMWIATLFTFDSRIAVKMRSHYVEFSDNLAKRYVLNARIHNVMHHGTEYNFVLSKFDMYGRVM